MSIFYRSLSLVALLALLGACAGTPENPRSTGMLIDDNILEVMIEREIRASDESFKGSHIVVAVYNGLVLLLGQVASEQLKSQASAVTESLYKKGHKNGNFITRAINPNLSRGNIFRQ